ncbi:MAG: mandelate racemase/muconate lactonizing enzyme family protein, partial [Mesorhizobium sp.]
MLGGKFRDQVRVYCDTDAEKPSGTETGKRLRARMERGFTFLKMDLGLMQIAHIPGAVTAPAGALEGFRANPRGRGGTLEERKARNLAYDAQNVQHPFTGLHFTEKGIDLLEQYIHEVREVIGYEIPLAIDHVGHISLQDGIRLSRRIEKYVPAWLEDVIPWQYTEQYRQLQQATSVPICTGEDIYLKEGFEPLLRSGGLSVIHPDLLTSGGILETKKIAAMAEAYHIQVAPHCYCGPIVGAANIQLAVTLPNFLILESLKQWDGFHATLLKKKIEWQDGNVIPSKEPGLGVELDEAICDAHPYSGKDLHLQMMQTPLMP